MGRMETNSLQTKFKATLGIQDLSLYCCLDSKFYVTQSDFHYLCRWRLFWRRTSIKKPVFETNPTTLSQNSPTLINGYAVSSDYGLEFDDHMQTE